MQIENVTAQSRGVLMRLAGDAARQYFHSIEPPAETELSSAVAEHGNTGEQHTNQDTIAEWQGRYVDITR
ncbi:MAG: hypothetical protein ACLFPO_09530 [Spirochaetaceae bacterium]